MTEFQNGNQNGLVTARLLGIWRAISVPITAIVLALVIGVGLNAASAPPPAGATMSPGGDIRAEDRAPRAPVTESHADGQPQRRIEF